MRHDVVLEGYGVRLRPVTLDDSEFIVKLRNMPHAIGNIGDSATTVEMQNKWLEKYFDRDNDYYFIVESLSSIPLGTVSVYDIDCDGGIAEYGRLVICPNSLSALPSCLLLLDFSIQTLKLKKIIARIVSTNKKVVDFNHDLGFEFERIVSAETIINTRRVDMVHMVLTEEMWQKSAPKLKVLAKSVTKLQIK